MNGDEPAWIRAGAINATSNSGTAKAPRCANPSVSDDLREADEEQRSQEESKGKRPRVAQIDPCGGTVEPERRDERAEDDLALDPVER